MIPAQLLVHSATVQPYAGSGAYGDTWGPEFSLPCYAEMGNDRVVDSNGDEVVSSGKVYADPATDGTDVPVGSKLTIFGRTGTVVTVNILDDGGLVGLSHREIVIR